MKRLSVIGFFSPDFMDQGERLTAQLRTWLDAGEIMTPFDETEGLENVLQAYGKLFFRWQYWQGHCEAWLIRFPGSQFHHICAI